MPIEIKISSSQLDYLQDEIRKVGESIQGVETSINHRFFHGIAKCFIKVTATKAKVEIFE